MASLLPKIIRTIKGLKLPLVTLATDQWQLVK